VRAVEVLASALAGLKITTATGMRHYARPDARTPHPPGVNTAAPAVAFRPPLSGRTHIGKPGCAACSSRRFGRASVASDTTRQRTAASPGLRASTLASVCCPNRVISLRLPARSTTSAYALPVEPVHAENGLCPKRDMQRHSHNGQPRVLCSAEGRWHEPSTPTGIPRRGLAIPSL
jgi:hypothetical protein